MPPPNPIDRVLGAIVPRAVDAVDIDEVVSQVDINHLVSQVDMNAIVDRLDIDALMARIDINGLIERVDLDAVLRGLDLDELLDRIDLNALVARLDVDALVGRIDIGALIARVDLNALVQQIDLNALIQGVDLNAVLAKIDLDSLIEGLDLPAIMREAKIDEIVSNASMGMTARLLDLVRRQIAALDLVLIGIVNRIFHRPREAQELVGGTLTGRIAGGVSRLSAFLLDMLTISLAYSLGIALVVFLLDLFTGREFKLTQHGVAWLIGYATFAGLYYWVGLTVTGRSVGKGLLGLRVVGKDGAPLSPGRAAVRTIVYPFSFIFALGLIPIVTGRRRRALHDWAAGTTVVYDWGDRPAELPGPLTDWIERRRGGANPDAAIAADVVAARTERTAAPTANGHRSDVTAASTVVAVATTDATDATDVGDTGQG